MLSKLVMSLVFGSFGEFEKILEGFQLAESFFLVIAFLDSALGCNI